MGNTQYERDRRAMAQEARQKLALLEAANDSLDTLQASSPALYTRLAAALFFYSLDAARVNVAYHDKQDRREQEEEDRKTEANLSFEELPDAPYRVQCQIEVGRDQGRWTQFGRCENAAKKIVYNQKDKTERCLCTVHAKEFALRGISSFGKWHDLPSHESWARVKYGKRK